MCVSGLRMTVKILRRDRRELSGIQPLWGRYQGDWQLESLQQPNAINDLDEAKYVEVPSS